MTQEKLAECLNVSFQAVSKWETGQASPDIGLLIPLSKALSVGVDELLGGDRRKEFEDRFQKSVCLGHKITWMISEEALQEFPDDETFLYRRACDEYFIGIGEDKTSQNERNVFLKKAERHFKDLCILYPNEETYKEFTAKTYYALGEKEKAIDLAHKCKTKNELLSGFFEGDDKLRHMQRNVHYQFHSLFYSLLNYNTRDSLETAQKILDIFYRDDRYVDELIWKLYTRLANVCFEEGDEISGKNNLEIAYEAAVKHDTITKEASVYTSTLFNLLSFTKAKDVNFQSSVHQFISEANIEKADISLKRKIIDNTISYRTLNHKDWVKYFKFCQNHINTESFSNFGYGWYMTKEEIHQKFVSLRDKLAKPYGTPLLVSEDKKEVERLITGGIMTGCVAFYEGEFFGFCNCGDKDKYKDIGIFEEEHKKLTAYAGAKIFSIVEIMVSTRFRNCYIEERLIDYALHVAKRRGYEYAEAYPSEKFFLDDTFDAVIKCYENKGFKIIRDLSNEEEGRHFIMQKEL